MNEYQNKNVLVLGMGLSGKSMARFFHKRKAIVQGFDDRSSENQYDSICKIYHQKEEVKPFDLLATSPGISIDHPIYQDALKKKIEIIGEIEVGVRSLKNKCIGITGTNGKSTTTSLIAHILNSAGIKAKALGNIGLPLTSFVDELEDEILVIELSSYQLDQLETPFLDLAILLNITPDHLQRYKTMENYARSKLGIERFLKKEGSFYLSKQAASFSPNLSAKANYLDEIPKELESFLNKYHPIERQNYTAAAYACKHFGLQSKDIILGCESFKGLSHRLEYVCDLKGVSFFNDSKASNIEAVIRAVKSIKNKIVLIMGGDDKGLDYSILKPYFLNQVKDICLIGEVKNKMAEAFCKDFNVHLCNSLEMAVKKAYTLAQKKEVVLLSPGSSSFGMFRNFEHRGDCFKEIVNQLEGEKDESP